MAFSRSLALWITVLGGCAVPSASIHEGPLSVESSAGQHVTLDELRAHREATVLVFWSATCPCVRRYQGRVDALLDTYPQERVRILAVSSNAGESFADVLEVAKERGVRVPLYRDEGGRLARALGARSTPTVVVLDSAGDIRFLGWIDNERLPGEPGREPWLDNAIQGVLAGNTAIKARSPVYGCPITRSLLGTEPAAAPRSCCTAKP